MSERKAGREHPRALVQWTGLTLSPDPRVPCVLVLDSSGSMAERKAGPDGLAAEVSKIEQLNAAIAEFERFIRGDKRTAINTEFAVVSFGGGVRVDVPFTPATEFKAPTLNAGGGTPLGSATLTALQLLSDRLAVYRQHDIDHHCPWLLIISDGEETESPAHFKAAAHAVCKLQKDGHLRAYVAGVDGADTAKLQALTAQRVFALRGLKFAKLFDWLYRSLRTVSCTQAGEDFEPEPPRFN